MNIFRLCGDLSHLFSILILLAKIWKTRSVAGISGKSQVWKTQIFLYGFWRLCLQLFICNLITFRCCSSWYLQPVILTCLRYLFRHTIPSWNAHIYFARFWHATSFMSNFDHRIMMKVTSKSIPKNWDSESKYFNIIQYMCQIWYSTDLYLKIVKNTVPNIEVGILNITKLNTCNFRTLFWFP